MTTEEENVKLKERIHELLVTIRNLSATIPYEGESQNAAVLIAEVGTLRSLLRETLEIAKSRLDNLDRNVETKASRLQEISKAGGLK